MRKINSMGVLALKHLNSNLTQEEFNEMEERFKTDPKARKEFDIQVEMVRLLRALAKDDKQRDRRR